MILRRNIKRRVIGDVENIIENEDKREESRKIIDREEIIIGIDNGKGLGRKESEILENGKIEKIEIGRKEGINSKRIGNFKEEDEISGDIIDEKVKGIKKMGRFKKVRKKVEWIIVDENREEKRMLWINIVGRIKIEKVIMVKRIVEFE